MSKQDQVQKSETVVAGDTSERASKPTYESPIVEVIGQMEDLTGSAGFHGTDSIGWGYY